MSARYWRIALGVLGVGAILLGVVWIGRGMEWFVWPADSFMAGETTWAWRGLALVAIGGTIAWVARRI